jgi:hypothetical protein
MRRKAKLSPDAWKALPEAQREDYVLVNGSYLLDVEAVDGFTLEDTGALKQTISALRTEKDGLEGRVAAFKGMDPEAAKEALAKREEMKTWTPPEKMSEREKALKDKADADLSGERATSAKYRGQLEKQLRTNEATKALVAAGCKKVRLLLPEVERQIRVEENKTTGELVARVVDANGNPAVTKKAGMGDMTIAELIEITRADPEFADCFSGSGASGTGKEPESGFKKPDKSVGQAEAGKNLEAIAAGEVGVSG